MVDERLLDILESFGLSFPTNRLLKSEIAQKKNSRNYSSAFLTRAVNLYCYMIIPSVSNGAKKDPLWYQ